MNLVSKNYIQCNVLYFKFNKDELKKPKNMIYWIGLNSCESSSAFKINNEFEWPAILEKYTNSIDSVLDKIPTTRNIMLSGWLVLSQHCYVGLKWTPLSRQYFIKIKRVSIPLQQIGAVPLLLLKKPVYH